MTFVWVLAAVVIALFGYGVLLTSGPGAIILGIAGVVVSLLALGRSDEGESVARLLSVGALAASALLVFLTLVG